MALVTGRLTEGKPIIEITLSGTAATMGAVGPWQDGATFDVQPYRALLDTGADITCVCDREISARRLRPFGFIRMTGAHGPSLHTTYIVRVGIVCGDQGGDDHVERSLFQLEPLEAAQIKDNSWFDVIIGTDVLASHEFSLTRGGGFRLELF